MSEASARTREELELSARDEAAGQGDAPWPPNYAKQPGEPPRVQPIEVEVVEETPEKGYLVIPLNRVAISEEQLEAASGGLCAGEGYPPDWFT